MSDVFSLFSALPAFPQEVQASYLFSYRPLNHVDPTTGEFICTGNSDCNSTRFDSCLVGTYCWPQCEGDRARAVAQFLKCYEGPFANTENLTDPTRRPTCMRRAGLDFDAVQACARNDTAGSLLRRMQTQINATRAPMYAALQPSPGLFPHIFVDGAHQWNNSWTKLLSTLCRKPQFLEIPPCQHLTATFAFDMLLEKSAVQARPIEFSSSVMLGVNYAASEALLPNNFRTQGEPDNAPSYVNIQAVHSASLLTLASTPDGWLSIELAFDGVLAGNVDALTGGVKSSVVTEYVAWALSRRENGGAFGHVAAKSIRGLHIVW